MTKWMGKDHKTSFYTKNYRQLRHAEIEKNSKLSALKYTNTDKIGYIQKYTCTYKHGAIEDKEEDHKFEREHKWIYGTIWKGEGKKEMVEFYYNR